MNYYKRKIAQKLPFLNCRQQKIVNSRIFLNEKYVIQVFGFRNFETPNMSGHTA